jgi:hypothetical protein
MVTNGFGSYLVDKPLIMQRWFDQNNFAIEPLDNPVIDGVSNDQFFLASLFTESYIVVGNPTLRLDIIYWIMEAGSYSGRHNGKIFVPIGGKCNRRRWWRPNNI